MLIERNGVLDASELNVLFSKHNWQVSNLEQLKTAIGNSWGWITARSNSGELIGFVQVISDGIRHAYILKMIVNPDFRRMGVGTKIMEELMDLLAESKMVPTLVASPGNKKFYEKFGFKTESNGCTAMCIR